MPLSRKGLAVTQTCHALEILFVTLSYKEKVCRPHKCVLFSTHNPILIRSHFPLNTGPILQYWNKSSATQKPGGYGAVSKTTSAATLYLKSRC